jgi:GDP-4-dehydro-6-deoxy-D-mannose reductase
MRALVTGATGFAGRHLCRHLIKCGHEVTGTALSKQERAPHPLVVCDVTDRQAVAAVVAEMRPEAIVHLAAIAFVPEAQENPEQAIRVNVGGTADLFQAAAEHAPEAVILAISSAHVYGAVAPDEVPVTEDHALAPASAYAQTKAAVETLADIWAGQLRIVVLRPFNHVGPGQSPRFAVSGFAQQIARIEAGQTEPVLRVGNLEAKRDFTDVRDVAEAYRLAIEAAEPQTPYNICSGKAVAIQEALDRLLALSEADIRVEQDPARLRPSDVPVLQGSAEKFIAATGWQQRHSLEQSLADTLEYWRKEE